MKGSHPENFDIMRWHRNNGGYGSMPAGHALRILREVVELCVASGAPPDRITTAVIDEIQKAHDRKEFGQVKTGSMHEEFFDVSVLMTVYENYFIQDRLFEEVSVRKWNEIVNIRAWRPDSEGVLWRPRRNSKPSVDNPPRAGSESS